MHPLTWLQATPVFLQKFLGVSILKNKTFYSVKMKNKK